MDIFWFDDVEQKLLLSLDVIIVVKDDPRRVDDAQATLKLNRLQFLRVSWLHCNGEVRALM